MMRTLLLTIILLVSCAMMALLPSAAITLPDHWVPEFDENGIDSEWARKVEDKLLWGFIDKSGKFVIPPIYENAESFSNGCAEVKKNGTTIYVDHEGNTISQPQNTLDDSADNDFRVTDFRKDIVDNSGNRLIAQGAKDIEVYPFSEGLAAIRMPLRLIARFYPENLPDGYVEGRDKGNDDFGKCGYIDESGQVVITPRFEHAYPFIDGLAKVSGWRQGGYIDRSGQYVGRHPCSDVGPFREGLARGYMRLDDYFFMNKRGKVILDHLQDASELSEDRVAIKKDNRWSLADQQGRHVCDLDADDVSTFSEGLALITKNHRRGYIDRTGALTIALQFEEAGWFSEGLAPVAVAPSIEQKLSILESKPDWQCGYLDTSGKVVISPKFRGARMFSEGVAPVRIGLKWGYIDKTGALKINPQFDDANSFSEGLAGVRLGYLWGFIDHNGTFVIAPRFGYPDRKERSQRAVGRFSEGVAFCNGSDFGWKYVDRQGHVCSAKWPGDFPTEENNFHEGLALVQVRPGHNWTGHAYMDKRDHIVSKSYFSLSSNAFSEGLAMVGFTNIDEKQPPKAGFIDKHFKFVIAPEYARARSFKEGLAAVAQGEQQGHEFVGKWGYIDRAGNKVTDLIFDDAEDFSEGFASIKIGSKWGFVDKTGKMVVSPKYDQVGRFMSGRALVKLGNRYGFIDQTGKLVIPIKYWLAGSFSDGMALVVFPADESEDVTTSHTLAVPIRDQNDLQDFVKHTSGE